MTVLLIALGFVALLVLIRTNRTVGTFVAQIVAGRDARADDDRVEDRQVDGDADV